MESILITGASGFIGSFIVEEALKRKFGVWAGIRLTSSKKYLKNRKIHLLDLVFAHPNAGRDNNGIDYATNKVFQVANFLIVETKKNKEENIRNGTKSICLYMAKLLEL